MNKLLLVLLAPLLLSSPALAGPNEDFREYYMTTTRKELNSLVNSKQFSDKQKIQMLADLMEKEARDNSEANYYLGLMIEGIGAAVEAVPNTVRGAMPPNMYNWEMPLFLVQTLMNSQKIDRAKVTE